MYIVRNNEEIHFTFKNSGRKALTKDLINKFSILNGAKYFSSEIFQNYLVFIPAKNYIKYIIWHYSN